MQITAENKYDSEFCGSIPLNLINLVQPHGILMVLDKNSLKIVQVSENIEKIFNASVNEFLTKDLAAFVAPNQVEEIKNKIARWNITDKIPVNLTFTTSGTPINFVAITHFKEEYIIMELEEVKEEKKKESFIHIYQEVKYITAALKEAQSIEELGEIAALEIKKLSGFDRVMLYKFDAAWNGTVVSEAKEEDMEPYLHLRFPASDIPKQARDLYFRNPYRLIPTCEFVPARLIPVVNPITRSFTDLSECLLRSVPTVHLEYLKNMQVTASMSIPVITNNKLWGLISCHHKTAKYPNYEMRSAFELLSTIVSAQLAAKESECDLLYKSQLNTIHAKLLEQMYGEKDFIKGLLEKPTTILELLQAEGAAIAYEGQITTLGKAPETEHIKDIIKWLQLSGIDKVFVTNNLSAHFVQSASYKNTSSGLIALPIASKRESFILGFRPEVVKTVEWGGNPNEAINIEADGKTYHPRNSFAIWKETVKEASLPWSAQEVEAAENLRAAVLEQLVRGR